MIRVRCPVCDRAMEGEGTTDLPFLPFCSERCKLIDLGRWLDGRYGIPANASGFDDEETVPNGDPP